MKRTLITPNLDEYPESLIEFLTGCNIYDSSCSKEARVLFADKDGGYYIKTAPLGTLENEATLTDYFHRKGLAEDVLALVHEGRDWMVTRAVKGEDCTYKTYLEDPKRLCQTLAECMRALHSLDKTDCPVQDRMKTYIDTVEQNYNAGLFDPLRFTKQGSKMTREEAFKYFWDNRSTLRSNCLIHGDFCLPNIMLDRWNFSGFIDLGNAGAADAHIDLFWCIWTLWFNLKTRKYTDYFLDAYGRYAVDEEKLLLIECAEAFG